MGDALAGYVAARCGLLSGFELICAVNENDALRQVMETGRMSRSTTVATPSPAMDITVPSNLERVLYEASGRDADAISGLYGAFAQSGDVELPDTITGPLGCMGFSAATVSNGDTLAEMQRVWDETGWMICPHTAVGTMTARNAPASPATDIVLSTAHAAKFPETVEEAIGRHPDLPGRCDGALGAEEHFTVLPAEQGAVRDYILNLPAGR